MIYCEQNVGLYYYLLKYISCLAFQNKFSHCCSSCSLSHCCSSCSAALITLVNIHFGASNIRPIYGYIWPADCKDSTNFSLSGLLFAIQNICQLPFCSSIKKKSAYFNLLFELAFFKHEGNNLKIKKIVLHKNLPISYLKHKCMIQTF